MSQLKSKAVKKTDHIVMRNGGFFCSHCGTLQELPFPMSSRVFSAMTKDFTQVHKHCAKTWSEPIPDLSTSEKARAYEWMRTGERGISSAAMWHAIMGVPNTSRWGNRHPCDPDDFRRCYLLLQALPEWKNKLELVKPLSPTWANLVDNWDKLTEMLEDLRIKDKDNGMYKFMETLGC